MGNAPRLMRDTSSQINESLKFMRPKCTKCLNEALPLDKCDICRYKFCSKCILTPVNKHLCLRCLYCGDKNKAPKFQDLIKLSNRDLLWMLKSSGFSIVGLVEKEDIIREIIRQYHIYHDIPEPKSSPFNSQRSRTESNGEASAPSPRERNPPSYDEHMSSRQEINKRDPNKRVNLKELISLEEIQTLSVKQLKDLLAHNLVDYKGCVERSELEQRVTRLWISYKENEQKQNSRDASLLSNRASEPVLKQSVRDETITARAKDSCENLSERTKAAKSMPAADVESPDSECKICMAAEIDAVLLECGHMVSCVDCSRQLAECPICQQRISRVVRVFRT